MKSKVLILINMVELLVGQTIELIRATLDRWSAPIEFLVLVAGLNLLKVDPLFSLIGALVFSWISSKTFLEQVRIKRQVQQAVPPKPPPDQKD